MAIARLEHYLVLAEDLEATKDFYVDVLGLAVGPRPPFPFPGYWLYAGDMPCVHMAARAGGQAQDDYLGGAREAGATGALDHVAFTATDLAETLARLEGLGIGMRRRTVPEQRSHQVFIQDPNGITIELNFSSGELEELEASRTATSA